VPGSADAVRVHDKTLPGEKNRLPTAQMDYKDIRLARLERNLRHLAEEANAFGLAEAARTRQAIADAGVNARAAALEDTTTRKPVRGRAAVVAWDIGHNPVGRAYVLYRLLEKDWDVDLIGPSWSRYGDELWEPLRGENLQVRTFRCSTLVDFAPKAEVLAATRRYDVVYVCKPRLPSLYLGALIKDSSDCPMILDVDDFELSFFKNESFASMADIYPERQEALREPFEELGTRYAQSLIAAVDAVTVSNVALRDRFGGHIVRHARDEQAFVNSTARRESARERLGIAETDYALVFVGTPRLHKGVLDVADAVAETGDPDIVFHLVGDVGDRKLREALQGHRARVVMHPNCAFEELPELLAGADLVPLIQDLDHPISQYQIPAKISDALSLGVPVLATRTPPLVDLIASGCIRETDKAHLAEAILTLKGERLDAGHDTMRARRDFVNEFGFSVNRARLVMAIDEAGTRSDGRREGVLDSRYAAAPWSPRRIRRKGDPAERDEGEARLSEPLAEMVDLVREQYRSERLASLTAEEGTAPPNRFPSVIRQRDCCYDIAFFWKQNDTGLYGRRSDMIARYLSVSGRVEKLLHLDAPRTAPSLEKYFAPEFKDGSGQEDLILRNLIDRQAGVLDTVTHRARTFIGTDRPRRGRLFGEPMYRRESYVRFVNEQLEEAGMRASQTVAWFCPVIWDAPEIIDKVGFGGVVADLIDDQRAWESTELYRTKLEESYRETLQRSDLVFANCDALADAMGEFAPNIHVVANGAERFSEFPKSAVPAALANIKGPIAGYVGNLRDRIDWLLLHQVVTAMPEISFVFFGPSGDNPNAESLAKYPNVHMPGLVPYASLPDHLQAFDVGLVPHLSNRMTERMNPLKVYNYFASGLPVVSSEIGNLPDFGADLRTATDAEGFIREIRAAVSSSVDTSSSEWQRTMDSIAWDTRVASILTIMDRSLRGDVRKSA